MTAAPRPWERPSTAAAAAQAARFAALVPELLTDRLRLRSARVGDFPIYARFLLDQPGARSDDTTRAAWLDFCEIAAGWHLRGHGPWTFEPRGGGDALGAVLIGHEYGDPEPELGWVMAPEAEGKGYATEAARAALAFAFGPLGFRTLVSYVDAANPRSAAVAERLGARRDPAAEAAIGHSCRVYRHLAPEILQ